jgi:hypothetical protein
MYVCVCVCAGKGATEERGKEERKPGRGTINHLSVIQSLTIQSFTLPSSCHHYTCTPVNSR